MPADLVSAGEEQIAAEATPFAATQETLTAPPDTRIPAAKTSTTSNATVAKDTTTRLTEPPLQRGLLEPAASGAWGGVTAPDVQGQQLPTRPPDRRGTAGEADYDSSLIDASGIACAANARARRRVPWIRSPPQAARLYVFVPHKLLCVAQSAAACSVRGEGAAGPATGAGCEGHDG